MILNDKKPDHQTAIGCLKDSDNFGKFFKYRFVNSLPCSICVFYFSVAYLFRVIQEKLKHIDKNFWINGHSGTEGTEVILGHLKSLAKHLVEFAVLPNPEDEKPMLLNCVNILILILQIVSNHFDRSVF